MRKIALLAAAATLVAAPAFAQSTSTVTINASVENECGVGNQSGGGTFPDNSSVNLGDITGANGFLDTATTHTIQFGNVWCNGPAIISMAVSPLANVSNTDTSDVNSFVSSVDMIVSGGPNSVFTYFQGAATSVRTGSPVSHARGGSFESGTGQYARASLNLALPAGTAGNDRPRAGTYQGSVVLTVQAN